MLLEEEKAAGALWFSGGGGNNRRFAVPHNFAVRLPCMTMAIAVTCFRFLWRLLWDFLSDLLSPFLGRKEEKKGFELYSNIARFSSPRSVRFPANDKT